MLLVLTILFVVALAAPAIFRKMHRRGFYVLAAAPAASFIWLVATFTRYTGADQSLASGAPNAPPSVIIPWVPQLRLELAFRLDGLSAVMCLLVLGVGALVLFYCAGYFKKDDANLGPFGAQLLAFAGAMFGLVTADNLILLFIFWELTTVLSYLLIGYARHRLSARRSALQALVVTTFGGLAMLVGLIMIGEAAQTYRISELAPQAARLLAQGPMTDAAIVLILIGAVSKSALVPFHFWLPAAMAAPTPVSAYLHAAAMVKAGIYLVARLAPVFAAAQSWQLTVMVLGLATMLIGGWRALHQFDLKLVLAYGTVSQLGFLTMVVGLGGPDGALAGLALLVGHACFKATLFLVVGIIDHQTGTRDVRELSGVFRSAPALGVIAAIAAASMAGLPPLLGFVAKESAYEAFLHNAQGAGPTVLLIGVVLGSVFTFAYSARFIRSGFGRKPGLADTAFARVPALFLAAPAVLTVATVVLGLWPAPLDAAARPYAGLFQAPAGTEAGPGLALWHGLTPVLGLTVLTFAAGALLVWALPVRPGPGMERPGVAELPGTGPAEHARTAAQRGAAGRFRLPDAERVYRGIIGVLDEISIRVTGQTQRGSLAFYLYVILSVAILAPLSALVVLDAPLPRQWYWFDSPAQAVAGLGVIVAAVAAVRAQKRFLAVLMVGVTGYGISLIFALQSAPDLALTQMLVETIALVAIVLSLRTLPARVRQWEPGRYRILRAVIGIAFGLAMMAFAATAMASRTAQPISLQFPQLAYDVGGGTNIVNVTLVDLRVWDTFGEISVLAVAATGVASLIFVRGRRDRRLRAVDVETGSVDRGAERIIEAGRENAALTLARRFTESGEDAWLVAGRTLAPERRSIIFEVVTRLLFHAVIIFSIYLLVTGHNTPGGGFAGGLVAGLALAIRYLAGGRIELAEASPVNAGVMLGAGLGTAALAAMAPLLVGGHVFQSAVLHATLPVFGDIKFVTATIFDIGVYCVVVGLVLDVLRSLGAEIDERTQNRPGQRPQPIPAGRGPQ